MLLASSTFLAAQDKQQRRGTVGPPRGATVRVRVWTGTRLVGWRRGVGVGTDHGCAQFSGYGVASSVVCLLANTLMFSSQCKRHRTHRSTFLDLFRHSSLLSSHVLMTGGDVGPMSKAEQLRRAREANVANATQ
jgi:hypothetical protein